jgi:hypothetical protein
MNGSTFTSRSIPTRTGFFRSTVANPGASGPVLHGGDLDATRYPTLTVTASPTDRAMLHG